MNPPKAQNIGFQEGLSLQFSSHRLLERSAAETVAYKSDRARIDERALAVVTEAYNNTMTYCIGYALHRRTPKARTRNWGRRRGRKMCVDREMGNGRENESIQFPETFGGFLKWFLCYCMLKCICVCVNTVGGDVGPRAGAYVFDL